MGKYFEILLIEDNISDVDLVKESLQNNGVICHMNVVNDGFEAMAYLGQQGIYAKATRPDLIILDLNLPKKNGFEVLEEIKGYSNIAHIPVVILTSSQMASDIKKCYQLHANAYIVKPSNLTGFRNVIRQIENFWFSVSELP